MPLLPSYERLAREKGLQKGRQEGLAEGLQIAVLGLLELKFKKVGVKLARKVRAVRDLEKLQTLLRAAKNVDTLDEVLALVVDE